MIYYPIGMEDEPSTSMGIPSNPVKEMKELYEAIERIRQIDPESEHELISLLISLLNGINEHNFEHSFEILSQFDWNCRTLRAGLFRFYSRFMPDDRGKAMFIALIFRELNKSRNFAAERKVLVDDLLMLINFTSKNPNNAPLLNCFLLLLSHLHGCELCEDELVMKVLLDLMYFPSSQPVCSKRFQSLFILVNFIAEGFPVEFEDYELLEEILRRMRPMKNHVTNYGDEDIVDHQQILLKYIFFSMVESLENRLIFVKQELAEKKSIIAAIDTARRRNAAIKAKKEREEAEERQREIEREKERKEKEKERREKEKANKKNKGKGKKEEEKKEEEKKEEEEKEVEKKEEEEKKEEVKKEEEKEEEPEIEGDIERSKVINDMKYQKYDSYESNVEGMIRMMKREINEAYQYSAVMRRTIIESKMKASKLEQLKVEILEGFGDTDAARHMIYQLDCDIVRLEFSTESQREATRNMRLFVKSQKRRIEMLEESDEEDEQIKKERQAMEDAQRKSDFDFMESIRADVRRITELRDNTKSLVARNLERVKELEQKKAKLKAECKSLSREEKAKKLDEIESLEAEAKTLKLEAEERNNFQRTLGNVIKEKEQKIATVRKRWKDKKEEKKEREREEASKTQQPLTTTPQSAKKKKKNKNKNKKGAGGEGAVEGGELGEGAEGGEGEGEEGKEEEETTTVTRTSTTTTITTTTAATPI